MTEIFESRLGEKRGEQQRVYFRDFLNKKTGKIEGMCSATFHS
jgi:hypothetical protein